MELKIIVDNTLTRYVTADEYELVGNSLRLYNIVKGENPDLATLERRELVAAYWGIVGFEVMEDG